MRLAFFCLIFILPLGNAYAQSATPTAIPSSNRQLVLSMGRQHIDYKEYDNYGITSNGVLDTEKGDQNSFALQYAFQGVEQFKDVYFGASYQYSRGNTTYDGYLQNLSSGAITPYTATSHSTTTDFQFKLGRSFAFVDKRFQLTPYVSYGYHEWVRDSRTDTYGYMELYEHQALGVGVLAQLAFTQRLVASVDFNAGRTLNPQMKVDQGPRYDLGTEMIYSTAVGLNYALSSQWHVRADYRHTTFKYGESKVVAGFYEPESKSELDVFSLGFGAAF